MSGNALEEAIANRLHNDVIKLQSDLNVLLVKKCIQGTPPVRVNVLAEDADFLNLIKFTQQEDLLLKQEGW